MDFSSFNDVLSALVHLDTWGYWIVFLISLAEALAFVGTLVPGASAVIIAGFLASQGVFHVGDLILFASLGAITGDMASYWLGTKGTRFFKHENRFLKLSHIDRGRAFFAKYGNKSILLGRFVGPIRAVLPFIAGLSHMHRKSFVFWIILSGFAWGAVHVLIGYVFGGAYTSIDALSRRAAIVLVVAVLSILLVWLLAANASRLFAYTKALISAFWLTLMDSSGARRFFESHPGFECFLNRRLNSDHFSGRPLSFVVGAVTVIAIFFAGLARSVVVSESIVVLDRKIETVLYAFRDPALAKIFLWITFLGNGYVIAALLVGAAAFLFLLGKRREAGSLALVIAGAESFVMAGKELVARTRPEGLIPYYTEHTFAFPSAHAAIGIAFFGFLAYAFMRGSALSSRARFSLGLSAFVISLFVAFSRLYLGVHYLSDVLGGYLVGLLWFTIGIAVNEWLHMRRMPSAPRETPVRRRALWGAGVAIAIAEVVFFIHFASVDRATFNTGANAPITVGDSIESTFSSGVFPAFADNIFSEAHYPISLIIIGPDDEALIRSFEAAGWRRASDFTFESLVETIRLGMAHKPNRARPVLPGLWFGKPNELAFVRRFEARGMPVHFVRVWKSPFLAPDGTTTYVVEASMSARRCFVFADAADADFDAERELLFSDLVAVGAVAATTSAVLPGALEDATFSSEKRLTDGTVYSITLK